MRPPEFWFRPVNRPGLWAIVLGPLGRLYGALTRRRAERAGTDIGIPVICVGNINLGGTGKTPTVIALIEILSRLGLNVHVVSRGYKGQEVGPVQVDHARHVAADVGDEPLLISAFAQVWVAKDRVAGARAAREAGADVVLLDDGFQNPGLSKTLSLVVVDAGVGFGNGRVFPAGPLREAISGGLSRADALILIGSAEHKNRFRRDWGTGLGLPVIGARLEPLQTGMDWQDLRALAFAGIGRPEKFFDTLRGLGAELVRTVPLDDHQPLSDALIKRLSAEAASLGAQLVTTEKDAVRLPVAFRQKALALPVRLRFDDAERIAELLRAKRITPGSDRA